MRHLVPVLMLACVPTFAIAAERPDWAYPPAQAENVPTEHEGDRPLQAPGSTRTYTRAQIDSLEKALDQYRLDMRRYPSTEEGLQALIAKPGDAQAWSGPYLKKAVPLDPWGRPYVYRTPGQKGEFELISYGRDGRPGGTGEDADIGVN